MKKVGLLFAALLMLVPFVVSAQVIVNDTFGSTLGDWIPGYGDWAIRGGMLVQRNTTTGLARIDRPVPQSGLVEISFKIRYQAGGFADEVALRTGQYHAGFGIMVGVENPPLRRVAWGAGNSYLLWLNLDTRPETLRNHPEHFGFRGQVYHSASNSTMAVTPMNVDIIAQLAAAGVTLRVEDLALMLDRLIPIRLRINYTTGRIMVEDPTYPTLWYYFDVDPAILRGTHVSLRTNSLSASYTDFSVFKY